MGILRDADALLPVYSILPGSLGSSGASLPGRRGSDTLACVVALETFGSSGSCWLQKSVTVDQRVVPGFVWV